MAEGRGTRRPRMLVLAEAVTLAHVGRPLALLRGLEPRAFEVHLACDPRYHRFAQPALAAGGLTSLLPLDGIGSAAFLRALARGTPVYDRATLERYVVQDRALLRELRPDLVVGDFRLSLSVSARLEAVPYLAISNAYWSPYLARPSFPLPVLPVSRLLPLALARGLFHLARPLAMALHARPLNQVRQAHGLTSLGADLRRVYTDADHVAYADLPGMFHMHGLPASHHFLGPVLWSPPDSLPGWWADLPATRKLVYLTLGSSGATALTRTVLDALEGLDLGVLVSTAGARLDGPVPANAYVADYLPGTQAAARADLVICNGGSPTSQQALAAGVPVLGIASNMDQFLNMQAVQTLGAGRLLRADRLSAAAVRGAAQAMLEEPGWRAGAQRLALEAGRCDAAATFAQIVGSMLVPPASAAAGTRGGGPGAASPQALPAAGPGLADLAQEKSHEERAD